jgi:hypothetical protein
VYYGGFAAAPVTKATLEAALAARSTPLDKRAMAGAAPPPLELPTTTAKATSKTVVITLAANHPARTNKALRTPYALPNVTGLPLRDAIRQLHASGYHVEVEGNGTVRSVSETRGNIVRIIAAQAAQ